MGSERSIIAAMIELASADRGDWESTIQHILSVEARVLDVDRASFWTVRGSLTLHNLPGEGATFMARLPLKPPVGSGE